MKNSLKYFGLWQKKRSELRIGDDLQTDWQQMQHLLDQHLPVEGDKPSRSKGFKLMSVLFVSMSAAAMTYVVSNVIEIKKHKHEYTNDYHHVHKVIPGIYGISNDSIQKQNAANPKKDSLITAKSTAELQNEGLSDPGVAKSSVTTPTKSAVIISASKSSATGGTTANSAGASVNKNNFTAIKSKNNSRSSVNSTNKSLFPAFGKRNTPKPGNSRRNSGRYGAAHGAITYSGTMLSGNLNRHANQLIVNGSNKPDTTGKATGKIDSSHMSLYPAVLSLAPTPLFNQDGNSIYPVPIAAVNINIARNPGPGQKRQDDKTGKAGKSSKTKSTVVKNSTPSNIDWGLLTGVNSSGSFTPKGQNSNFYGSSPVDFYFGLYGTYNLNNNWGINTQVKLFSPQTITTNYSHANGSKADSGQTLQIVNSAKFYSVSVPVRAMYRLNNNISLVGGPVINIPVKLLNIKSSLSPAGIKADSAYYAKTINLLNGTTYQQSLNFGITGGVNFQFKRLSFEASWLRSLSGYQVTSGFGSGRSYNSTFQFTIGFQLSKMKP